MTASRLAVVAAIVSVVAWGLKAVAIGVAGGLDESPLESPLFVFGLVAIVVAFASLGVAVARERPLAFKVIGGVVGVLIGFGLSMLASVVAAAVIPDSAGWVQPRSTA
jgi:drug/metabolite transporter (DMT)-like permease